VESPSSIPSTIECLKHPDFFWIGDTGTSSNTTHFKMAGGFNFREGASSVSATGEDNDADILTKNTTVAVFNKHVVNFVGHDEYVQVSEEGNSKLQVRRVSEVESGT
jgi:hypothetical protein